MEGEESFFSKYKWWIIGIIVIIAIVAVIAIWFLWPADKEVKYGWDSSIIINKNPILGNYPNEVTYNNDTITIKNEKIWDATFTQDKLNLVFATDEFAKVKKVELIMDKPEMISSLIINDPNGAGSTVVTPNVKTNISLLAPRNFLKVWVTKLPSSPGPFTIKMKLYE